MSYFTNKFIYFQIYFITGIKNCEAIEASGQNINIKIVLKDMKLKTEFYEIYSNLKSFSEYDQQYSNNQLKEENKEEWHIYPQLHFYQNIFLNNNKLFTENRIDKNLVEDPIIEAHLFLKNLIESLKATDDLLNYFSLLDSEIIKDVFNNDFFKFNKQSNNYNQVKVDLINCLFNKFCLFNVTDTRCDFSFLKYFNENYCESHIKNTQSLSEGVHCAYGFIDYGLIEDIVFINFNSIFNSLNNNFPFENQENNTLSSEMVMHIHKFNMIIFHMHEMSHNKIFKYALLHRKKFKSSFNTPIIKLIGEDPINESGFLMERLIAVNIPHKFLLAF